MSNVERAVRDSWLHLHTARQAEFNSIGVGATGGQQVRIAVDNIGRPHILVEGVRPARFDVVQGALSLDIRELVFDGAASLYLDVRCGDPDLDEEFKELAADVALVASEADDPVTASLVAIDRWRRLFRIAAARSLNEQQRRGLFAELSVLQSLAVGPDAWRGPLGAHHDFELDAVCLEVKAIGESSTAISVHGIEQLDTHDQRPLWLGVIDVRSDPGGKTLAELVAELESATSDRALLRSRLAQARFDLASPIFQVERYSVVSSWGVPMRGEAPRLTEANLIGERLPEGIGSLNYEIEVAALLAHAVPLEPRDLVDGIAS